MKLNLFACALMVAVAMLARGPAAHAADPPVNAAKPTTPAKAAKPSAAKSPVAEKVSNIVAEVRLPGSDIPIRFTLDKPAYVTVVIEDAAGKRVRNLAAAVRATGKIDIIQYGLLTSMEDMFQISLRKLADAGSVPVAVDIPAQGFQDLKLELPIPERFGAYALVLDLPGQERLLVASLVRTYKNPPLGDSYRLCMDINNVPALVRLGAAPNHHIPPRSWPGLSPRACFNWARARAKSRRASSVRPSSAPSSALVKM